jgi:hypothetical protein
MKHIFLLVSTLIGTQVFAQNVGINATGAAPVSSAALDVDMANKGILIPRVALTTTAAFAPVTGTATTSLLVYNTATAGAGATAVTPGYYYWDGAQWVRMIGGTNSYWRVGTSAADVNQNGATRFIGTTTNDHMDYVTNGVVRGRFSNLGEFFVGTTTTALPGDLMNGVGNATFPWAVNGYTSFNGGGVFGSVQAGSTAFSAIEGSYSGTGAGGGVFGNYIGAAGAGTTPTGVIGNSNPSVAGNTRIGVRGDYGAAHFGIGVIGIGFGGGIPTGNFDFGVVGWRANNANFSGYFNGNHVIANGTKSASVGTSKGNQLLYVVESPEVWFEEIGNAQLINGRAVVNIDPLFLETILVDEKHPMEVFIQVQGECNDVYVVPGTTSFEVVEKGGGTSNVKFSYRVMAKRLHFADHRFGSDPVWGPGDTRKYNSDAIPRPIDYNEGLELDKKLRENPEPVNYPPTILMGPSIEQKAKVSVVE